MTRTFQKLILLVSLFPVPVAALARSTTYNYAYSEILQFTGALETFRIDYGRYPTQAEGLSAVKTRPADISDEKWKPYLRDPNFKDSWGNPYVYRIPGTHNRNSFDIYSCGKDGISKTGGDDPDDINNWDHSRKWYRHYEPPPISPRQAAMFCAAAVALVYLAFAFRRKIEDRWKLSS